MKDKLRKNSQDFWGWAKAFFLRREAIYASILLLVLGAVIWQLSLIPSESALYEISYTNSTNMVSDIIENPLSLPHKAASFIATTFFESVRVVRGISILFFGLSVVALYRILKRWHSDLIALFGATLFATNAMVLAIGRLASPLVLLFTWSFIVSVALWLRHGKSKRIAPVTLVVLSGFLVYVPGAPYFLLLFMLLYGNKFTETIRSIEQKSLYIAVFAGLVVVAPLVFSMTQNVDLLRQWLLIPDTIYWGDVPRNILQVPSSFIYRSQINPLLHVGRLPVFDVAAGGLFLVGLYAYRKYLNFDRTRIMLLTALLAIILGAFGQTLIAVVILIPYAYAIVAAGISHLLDQWYNVFPKNPFARSFGLILMIGLLGLSVYYQLHTFFVVWPQTPETRSVYSQSRILE